MNIFINVNCSAGQEDQPKVKTVDTQRELFTNPTNMKIADFDANNNLCKKYEAVKHTGLPEAVIAHANTKKTLETAQKALDLKTEATVTAVKNAHTAYQTAIAKVSLYHEVKTDGTTEIKTIIPMSEIIAAKEFGFVLAIIDNGSIPVKFETLGDLRTHLKNFPYSSETIKQIYDLIKADDAVAGQTAEKSFVDTFGLAVLPNVHALLKLIREYNEKALEAGAQVYVLDTTKSTIETLKKFFAGQETALVGDTLKDLKALATKMKEDIKTHIKISGIPLVDAETAIGRFSDTNATKWDTKIKEKSGEIKKILTDAQIAMEQSLLSDSNWMMYLGIGSGVLFVLGVLSYVAYTQINKKNQETPAQQAAMAAAAVAS